MARTYKFTFRSPIGDLATAYGQGNTRRVAERSARRNLPQAVSGEISWRKTSCAFVGRAGKGKAP
jgi:hypothetical protein